MRRACSGIAVRHASLARAMGPRCPSHFGMWSRCSRWRSGCLFRHRSPPRRRPGRDPMPPRSNHRRARNPCSVPRGCLRREQEQATDYGDDQRIPEHSNLPVHTRGYRALVIGPMVRLLLCLLPTMARTPVTQTEILRKNIWLTVGLSIARPKTSSPPLAMKGGPKVASQMFDQVIRACCKICRKGKPKSTGVRLVREALEALAALMRGGRRRTKGAG